MKPKYIIVATLFFIIGIFVFLLLEKQEPNQEIITMPRYYGQYHTSREETIDIPLLMKNVNGYYIDVESIANAKIFSDEESISVDIVAIEVGDIYDYNDTKYTQTQWTISIPFEATDFQFQIDPAYFEFTYSNAEQVRIHIGEFVYVYDDIYESYLTVGDVVATHDTYQDVETINGIYLSLANLSNKDILITDINIPSNHIHMNYHHFTRPTEVITYNTSVESLLQVETYDLFYEFSTSFDPFVCARSGCEIYVPFVYDGTLLILHRFPIIVTYSIAGESHQLVIDDFPLIQTSPFQPGYDAHYVEAVFLD